VGRAVEKGETRKQKWRGKRGERKEEEEEEEGKMK